MCAVQMPCVCVALGQGIVRIMCAVQMPCVCVALGQGIVRIMATFVLTAMLCSHRYDTNAGAGMTHLRSWLQSMSHDYGPTASARTASASATVTVTVTVMVVGYVWLGVQHSLWQLVAACAPDWHEMQGSRSAQGAAGANWWCKGAGSVVSFHVATHSSLCDDSFQSRF